MTEQEATEVVAFLAAGFPGFSMESASFDVWVRLMQELEDPECAALVAVDYARFDDKFPSYADFRRTYRTKAAKMAEAANPQASAALDVGPRLEAPGWVRMWASLRDADDMRAFAEQEWAYLRGGLAWPPEAGVVSAEELAKWVFQHPTGTVWPERPILRSI